MLVPSQKVGATGAPGAPGTTSVTNVASYGAINDGVYLDDGITTSGNPTLISSSAIFHQNDTGKILVLYTKAAAAKTMVVALVTTITYVNATTVTMAANAPSTITGLSFFYGSDNLTAFNATLSAAVANPDMVPTAILQTPTTKIQIPAGIYLLSNKPDVLNKLIVWEYLGGGVVAPATYLTGKLSNPGINVVGSQHGILSNACTFSVLTGEPSRITRGAEVSGYCIPSELGTYPSRDSVGLYVDNWAPAALITAAGSYTSTTFIPTTPLTSTQLKVLRVGMIINTSSSTTSAWSGLITWWALDGTSVTVSQWWKSGSAGTPGNSTAYFNPFSKVWAHNANVGISPTSYATEFTGFELGLFNSRSASATTWGFDVINLGAYKCTYAFISRGSFTAGFAATNTGDYGFYSSGNTSYSFFSTNFNVTSSGALRSNLSIYTPTFSTGIATWTSGTGSPEGVVTASIGSLFTRLDGAANTTLYVKESGTSNTGWVAK